MLAAVVAMPAMTCAFQVNPAEVARARHSSVHPAMSIVDVPIGGADMIVGGGVAYLALCIGMCGNDMEKADTSMNVWLSNKKDTAKMEKALALYDRWEKHPVDQLILVAQLFGNPPRVLLILVTMVASATLASTMAVGIDGSHGTMGLSAEDVHTVQKFAVVAGMKGGMTVLAIAALCVAQCGNDRNKMRSATEASGQNFNKGTRAKWKATADFLEEKWENTPKLSLVPELPKVPELPEVPQVLQEAFRTVSRRPTSNDPKTTTDANARASTAMSGNMDAMKNEPRTGRKRSEEEGQEGGPEPEVSEEERGAEELVGRLYQGTTFG